MADGRTKAKWRAVACPTCTSQVGQSCHILSDPNAKLVSPHLERIRIVDPFNPRLRASAVDAYGNRLIDDATIVAKCIVRVRGGAKSATWRFPEHDPSPNRARVGDSEVAECQRCGALVLVTS
jgi:hypothetical protein